MRKLAFALTMLGGLLAAGVPAAKANVAGPSASTHLLYGQYQTLDLGLPADQQIEGANHELVRYRGYYPYYRYRSPSYYRGYRGPGYYGGPRYYRGPGYYRDPGYYRYRYGAPYYGGGWGYGGPGVYFRFGF